LDRGFIECLIFFPFERGLTAIACAALSESALLHAVAYCKDRRQFGQPIIEFQMVQQMLAEMAVDLHVSKTLTRDALRKYASGADANVEASIAKVFASEAAQRVTSNAMQLLGGYGYTREFPVERWFRDARVYAIAGGTTQIQKLIVARALM
jgi:alkylation response protein AidB-like acyl-CoA dehydrogenase